LIAAGLWLLLAGQAQAVESNGPYYATPSWAQKLPAATRFVVLTDWGSQAVLDRETGLVWERSPVMAMHTWSDARFQCASRTTGGRKGWRLPSLHEMASLIDPTVASGPPLPAGHPFTGVLSTFYWSATTLAENPTRAWGVLFGNGGVATGNKPGNNPVWCVRGGHNDGSEY
jgi:hypothetical protein